MSKCVKCGNEILTGDIHWEMGLCNNCYNELYKDHKTHISLDKMWLNLAQSFRDENEKLQEKIADLEAKLAELREQIDIRDEENGKIFMQSVNAMRKNVELKQQLAEKDKAIENWQTIYESVVQTCHNDKEEIERLNKRLETQENTITNLVEDNRASQEWYKKQLEEKEKENTKLKEVVDCVDKLKQFNADMKDYALVNRDIADEIYCEHQDKISFALEQLEKVKETAECVLDNALKNSSLNESYYDRLLDEIDNQIEELKKEMK